MKPNRVLQILVGNRETMKKGFASGTITTLIISILYLILVGSPAGLLILILAAFLGHAFGWLFIRPIAQIIQNRQPHFTDEIIWRNSSLYAWMPIALIIFFPKSSDMIFMEKLIVIGSSMIGVSIASVAGGYRASRVRLNVFYKESKAYGIIGGKATGLLLAIVWLASGFPAFSMQVSDGIQATFANYLATILIFAVLATFPCHIVFLIGYLLDKNNDSNRKWQLPYVISGAIIWGGLSVLLFIFPGNSVEKNFVNYLLIPAISLCGGIGGWVIGQYLSIQYQKRP